MKKLIKKFKKWLIHKLGGYLCEDGYTKTIDYCETITKPAHLKFAVKIPPRTSFRNKDEQFQYTKDALQHLLGIAVVSELPTFMSYVIESSPINLDRVIECQLDVIPPVNRVSLADLFAEEETEKETKE